MCNDRRRCSRCGLSRDDVPRPENFRLHEVDGVLVCNLCLQDEAQAWPDGRSGLQRLLDEWATGEPDEEP